MIKNILGLDGKNYYDVEKRINKGRIDVKFSFMEQKYCKLHQAIDLNY